MAEIDPFESMRSLASLWGQGGNALLASQQGMFRDLAEKMRVVARRAEPRLRVPPPIRPGSRRRVAHLAKRLAWERQLSGKWNIDPNGRGGLGQESEFCSA